MKSLTDYEKTPATQALMEVQWQQSASRMIFSRDLNIPLTTAMIKRIFGRIPRKTVFHVTSSYDIRKTLALQGTKRSISAMMKAQPRLLRAGIQTAGGIVFEMEADILVSAPTDIMSTPDKSGRRWIESYYIPDQKLSYKIDKEGNAVRSKLLKKYFPDLTWIGSPAAAWAAADPQLKGKKATPEQRKMLRQLIGEYIREIEKVVAKNAAAFQQAFMTYHENDKAQSDMKWDEAVVNNFDVKHIHVVDPRPEVASIVRGTKVPFTLWGEDGVDLAKYMQSKTKKIYTS